MSRPSFLSIFQRILPDGFLRVLMRPATAAYWRAALARENASFGEALHGYCYLKWPRLYISLGLGRGALGRLAHPALYRLGDIFGLWSDASGKRFADTYHGKVMPPAEMSRLIRINRPLVLEVPETVLPYPLARSIVLEHPSALALFECPCRASMPDPCLPLEVCIIVGQPFVDFVLSHHPTKSRRITPDQALAVIQAAHKRGHVSHAFFKEAVLGRYYAVCNCCSCCCGAMQAHRNGAPMLASSGYLAVLAPASCISCGLCAIKCPFSAIAMREERDSFRPLPVIDPARCLGCGICASHCPQKALRLERDPAKPAPLDIPSPLTTETLPEVPATPSEPVSRP